MDSSHTLSPQEPLNTAWRIHQSSQVTPHMTSKGLARDLTTTYDSVNEFGHLPTDKIKISNQLIIFLRSRKYPLKKNFRDGYRAWFCYDAKHE